MRTIAADVAADRRRRAKALERARWRELRATYQACVAIAEQVWTDRLNLAEEVQQKLAETMYDRTRIANVGAVTYSEAAAIMVPLFTPRDRAQFVKEAAATLLISADRQNLVVTPELPENSMVASEAASGVEEAAP